MTTPTDLVTEEELLATALLMGWEIIKFPYGAYTNCATIKLKQLERVQIEGPYITIIYGRLKYHTALTHEILDKIIQNGVYRPFI